MIRLSIVIPVYNVEHYLPKCLDSLLSEDAEDYEIILVNDGSTDGSLVVAEAYRSRFPERITVITTENHGQGHARNIGIERAMGEFLYFIDSDDYLAEGGLRGIRSCLDKDFDICIFDTIAVNTNGRELKTMPGCDRREDLNLSAYPALLLQGPDVWNKIFRRSLFLDSGVRFPCGVWFEDLAAVPKLYAFTDRILYIPQAWHRYLQRTDSVTNTSKAMRNLEIIPAVDELRSFYRAQGRFDELKDELDYLVFYCEFLTSSVRANLADRRSPAQEILLRDFLEKVPDFRENPYVKKISRKHRLLTWLLLHRMRLAVHVLMTMNNKLKDKRV
ncbi:MAG: glycosyltransferase [Oscillospiraceae bacterium]|nr:glycosyltransferase [Oscillospiraceae bacterium]